MVEDDIFEMKSTPRELQINDRDGFDFDDAESSSSADSDYMINAILSKVNRIKKNRNQSLKTPVKPAPQINNSNE